MLIEKEGRERPGKKRDNGGVGRGRSRVRVARGTTATVVPGPPSRVRPPRSCGPASGSRGRCSHSSGRSLAPRAAVTRRRSSSSGPRNPGLSRGRATSALIAVTNRRPAGQYPNPGSSGARTGPEKILDCAKHHCVLTRRFIFLKTVGEAWKGIKKSVESASAEAPDARGGACAGQREARPELRAFFLPAVSQIHS